MKCVILAAGRGTRMLPLTLKTPKLLVKVAGKPLLEHILEVFEPHVLEFVIVIGYHSAQIQDYFSYTYKGKKITYVFQDEPKGTFKALLLVRKFLKKGERFFVVGGDDMHESSAVGECLKHDLALVVKEIDDPRPYGVVSVGEGGRVVKIVEKPENPESTIVSTGLLLLNETVFDYPVTPHKSGEYFLTEAVGGMLKERPIMAIRTSFWFPISTPHDVAAYEKLLSVEN